MCTEKNTDGVGEIMRVKRIKNVSDHTVQVNLDDGVHVHLPAGQEIRNVRVNNICGLKEDCEILSDLGEIQEHRTGKTRLND